ncbi:MAG: transposase [Rhodobiaceae bacterium]|nr:transposase [Rhodobiaceae bacterium]
MAQWIINAWKDDYNEHRPHSSLNGLSPVEYATLSQVDKTVNTATL